MKKYLLAFFLSLLLVFTPLFFLWAAVTIPNPLTSGSFEALIANVIGIIFKLALLIAPVMLIIAGIMFMTAAGDPAKIQNAQNLAKWVIIGLLIAILARSIVGLLETTFLNKPSL